MIKYDFHKREQNLDWSIKTIEVLLENSTRLESASYLIYAALECRIIIERVEFEILVMAAHESENKEWIELIKSFKGIQKVNSKYKGLKMRYQTFTEAFSKALIEDYPLKPFDFKAAETLQSELSQYIHIYYRQKEELDFESTFMQAGFQLIKTTLTFLENLFLKEDDGYLFGVLNFASLKDEVGYEFKDWLQRKDEDVESLTNRLIAINENRNNGQKLDVKL